MTRTNRFLMIVTLSGTLLNLPAQSGEVRAAVAGIIGTRGHIICGIFKSAEGFPNRAQRAFKLVSVPANPDGALCNFLSLPAGNYAVSIFHDENDNGVLDTNLVGMPREGYGFSNNHTYSMHPASFAESRFTVDEQSTNDLLIRLKY